MIHWLLFRIFYPALVYLQNVTIFPCNVYPGRPLIESISDVINYEIL
jgi:hypothetical protein